jgi:hypothetical protein
MSDFAVALVAPAYNVSGAPCGLASESIGGVAPVIERDAMFAA